MDNKRKAALAVACTLGASVGISNSSAAPILSADGSHTYDDDIVIPTLVDPLDPENLSQMALPANIRIPVSDDPSTEFPLVIFINSWALDEYEYSLQSEKFAEQGYAVLSYTTRGFGGAPGVINTAGEKDIYDTQQAISYALENYPIDTDAIALGGVSYGAGISLLASFQDERVDAVIAMSGWGSLVESLWAGYTPNSNWINVLINSGKLRGNLDPIVTHNYGNMKNHENIDSTMAWGEIRSPLNYIDQVNAREKPPALFISNNLHDYLFQPNSMVELLSNYAGPWRCQFNYGTHGQGEAGGLTSKDSNSVPWVDANHWLDHYLKGIDNGIDQLKPVNTVVRSRAHGLSNRESFDGFPVAQNQKTFYLAPADGGLGNLQETEDQSVIDLTFDRTKSVIKAGGLQGALFGNLYYYKLDDIDLNHSVAFMSEPQPDGLYIRGEINLELWAQVEDKSQYFGYLLDYDPETENAVWLGHAPFTWHTSELGEPPEGPAKINLNFYWTSYDVQPGHSLVLIVEGRDPDYWPYENSPETNTLLFGGGVTATLSIPYIAEPVAYSTFDNPEGDVEKDSSRGANGSGSNNRPAAGGSFGLLMLLGCILAALSRSRRFRL